MSITTFDSFKDKLNTAQFGMDIKAIPAVNNPCSTTYRSAPFPGTTPTSSEACYDTTAGALLPEISGTFTNTRYLAEIGIEVGTLLGQAAVLCDRLVHSGGLSGIVTTAQTTNLQLTSDTPPRFSTGAGVLIGLEIYIAIGATATTATVNYTNQSGVSNRTTKAIVFGGGGNNAVGSFRICPLQDGDTGVRSVQSVTLAASTATAGNFGVTLFKPLTMMCNTGFGSTQIMPYKRIGPIGGAGQMPIIPSNACLFLLCQGNASGSTAFIHAKVIED